MGRLDIQKPDGVSIIEKKFTQTSVNGSAKSREGSIPQSILAMALREKGINVPEEKRTEPEVGKEKSDGWKTVYLRNGSGFIEHTFRRINPVQVRIDTDRAKSTRNGR